MCRTSGTLSRSGSLGDQVVDGGETLIVTKRGRPVARVLPIEPPPSLSGSVR